MASLFTNVSAQTALKTLTAASKSLSATQNRVSTGYRINTAEDNAAYWSIATTLRSDVNALGAVKDALGLGAATVDTVYTGINDTKDLLDQVKTKLVAASQSGVPKGQVQAEITQLQNRLADTSKSTVINSESWLTQDSTDAGYNNNKDTVGSFTRGSGGVITIENITIDISKTKLYETGTAKQDAAKTSLDTSTAGALKAYTDAFADIKGVVDATDANWNTEVANVGTDATNGVAVFGVAGISAALTNASTVAAKTAWAAAALTDAQLTTAFADLSAAFGGDGAEFVNSLTTDQRSKMLGEINTHRATLQTAVRAVADDGTVVTDDGVTQQNAAFDTYKASVQDTLTKFIGTSARDSFVAKVGADAQATYSSTAKSDAANNDLGIFDKVRTVVSDADGTNAKAVRVKDIDISKLTDTAFDKGVLTSYIKAVDDALQELTTSAAVIGAAKARIGGNQTFVQNLIDANNRGIGQLVDADLNEESSKLKALQVQEQLAVQALGIANNATQNVLSLFQ